VNKHYGLIEGINKIEMNLNLLELVGENNEGSRRGNSQQSSQSSMHQTVRSRAKSSLKLSKTLYGNKKQPTTIPKTGSKIVR
jgi:hypothetical protein